MSECEKAKVAAAFAFAALVGRNTFKTKLKRKGGDVEIAKETDKLKHLQKGTKS